MSGFNLVVVLGRLVATPERIPTKSGSVMLKATLEVSTYRRTSDGANEEQTTRVPVTLFGKLATTFEQYVQVGDLTQLVGRLDGYERPAKSGTGTWLTLSFVAEQLILLPNSRRTDAQNPATSGPSATPSQTPAQKEIGRGFKSSRYAGVNELGEPEDINF